MSGDTIGWPSIKRPEGADKTHLIGDFRFGLDSEQDHARYVESIYRELEPLKELGEIPAGTTFWEVADVILDTIAGYASMATIEATELGTLISDAVEQLAESNEEGNR